MKPQAARHCPTCQYNKTQQWLQTQIQRQLPGHHFLITFTVPEPLRYFMRQHQRVGYSELSYGFAVDLPVPEIELARRSLCPSCSALLKLDSVLPPLKVLRRSG